MDNTFLEPAPSPPQLGRDALFYTHPSARMQTEFVVDSQSVPGLGNATLAVTNSQYEENVKRIRVNVWKIFGRRCDYKAGFVDPIDWRPREWNVGADHLVKYAIAERGCGGNLSPGTTKAKMADAIGLQFYSDGGFVPGVGGAFGVQLFGHYGDDQHQDRKMLGYVYQFREHAKSAFEMELAGLEWAVTFHRQACESN